MNVYLTSKHWVYPSPHLSYVTCGALQLVARETVAAAVTQHLDREKYLASVVKRGRADTETGTKNSECNICPTLARCENLATPL